MAEGMYDCCAIPENRVEHVLEDGPIRDDLTISVCSVCGRRHIELNLDAGNYNFKLI